MTKTEYFEMKIADRIKDGSLRDKFTYRGKVYWFDLSARNYIFAHSVDEEILGSISGYKAAEVIDNKHVVWID